AGCVSSDQSQFRTRALGAIPSSAILFFAASGSGACDGFALVCPGSPLARSAVQRSLRFQAAKGGAMGAQLTSPATRARKSREGVRESGFEAPHSKLEVVARVDHEVAACG